MFGHTTRRRFLLMSLAIIAAPVANAADDRPVRFGLTAVVVRDSLSFFERWADYLGRRVGRPVQFVQRRSYRDVMQLIETGDVDFAWICEYPYVQASPDVLELVATPIFQGVPLFRTYIIVNRDSPFATLEDLKGRVFAFSDPESNTGFLAPRDLVAKRGHSVDRFFRLTFFTYSHAETVEAVADRVADGGAVESYVWEHLRRTKSALADRTRIIERSELYGFAPIVMRRGIAPRLGTAMRNALIGMRKDKEGAKLLVDLSLDGFGVFPSSTYDSVRAIARRLNEEVSLQ